MSNLTNSEYNKAAQENFKAGYTQGHFDGANWQKEQDNELLEALQDLVGRADKAREILQNPTSPSHGFWGMLDTETAKAAINKHLNKKT